MNFFIEANYDWMELLSFPERPFRAKIVPSKIWSDLDEFRNDQLGLANYCKKWRTKIKWIDAGRCKKHVKIGGEYDYDSRQCTIEIYTLNFNSYVFADKQWDRFKMRFIQTLMHEMIHFMQYDKRGDKALNRTVPFKHVENQRKTAEREYLSDPDEIQAYAHCVYLDIQTSRLKMPLEDFLQQAKTYSPSSTLTYILKTFDYDYRNNHAIPLLAWHVMKWHRKYQKLAKHL